MFEQLIMPSKAMVVIVGQVISLYMVTHIITEQEIFDPLRAFLLWIRLRVLHDLLSCFLCTSFWLTLGALYFFKHELKMSWSLFFVYIFFANLLNELLYKTGLHFSRKD